MSPIATTSANEVGHFWLLLATSNHYEAWKREEARVSDARKIPGGKSRFLRHSALVPSGARPIDFDPALSVEVLHLEDIEARQEIDRWTYSALNYLPRWIFPNWVRKP